MEDSVYRHLEKWVKLHKKQKSKKDVWTNILGMSFRNLRITHNITFISDDDSSPGEVNISFEADSWKPVKNKQ